MMPAEHKMVNLSSVIAMVLLSLYFWSLTIGSREQMRAEIGKVETQLQVSAANLKHANDLVNELSVKMESTLARLDRRTKWMEDFTSWVESHVQERFTRLSFIAWTDMFFWDNPELKRPANPVPATFGKLPEVPK